LSDGIEACGQAGLHESGNASMGLCILPPRRSSHVPLLSTV